MAIYHLLIHQALPKIQDLQYCNDDDANSYFFVDMPKVFAIIEQSDG